MGYGGGKESRRLGGGSVVENYTTSINHFYTTVFLSPSISRVYHLPCAFSPSVAVPLPPSWPCISLSSFVLPLRLTSTVPKAFSYPLASFGPRVCPMCFIWSTAGHPHHHTLSTSFPLWFCLYAFFIDLSFVAYQGFIPGHWYCISKPPD